MAYECASLLNNKSVQGVDTFRVDMVEPGSKDTISPEFAMVFVRNEVVWIVGARAVESDPPHHLSGDCQARDGPVGSVGIAFYVLQQPVNIAKTHFALNAAGWREDSAFVYDKVSGSKLGDVVLGSVITKRPEQLGNHHLRPCCHSSITRRIKLEEPDLARRVSDCEPGSNTVRFGSDDSPLTCRRTAARIATACNFFKS